MRQRSAVCLCAPIFPKFAVTGAKLMPPPPQPGGCKLHQLRREQRGNAGSRYPTLLKSGGCYPDCYLVHVRAPWRGDTRTARARKGRIDDRKEPSHESRDRQAKQAKSYIGSFFVGGTAYHIFQCPLWVANGHGATGRQDDGSDPATAESYDRRLALNRLM